MTKIVSISNKNAWFLADNFSKIPKIQMVKSWRHQNLKNSEIEEVGAEEVGFQRKYSGREVQIVYKIYNFKIFKIAK